MNAHTLCLILFYGSLIACLIIAIGYAKNNP